MTNLSTRTTTPLERARRPWAVSRQLWRAGAHLCTDDQVELGVQVEPRVAARGEEEWEQRGGEVSDRLDWRHRHTAPCGGVVALMVVRVHPSVEKGANVAITQPELAVPPVGSN